MALLEKEAIRFAESLDDYEHVSVTDIGGWGPIAYWVVVSDIGSDSTTRSRRRRPTSDDERNRDPKGLPCTPHRG